MSEIITSAEHNGVRASIVDAGTRRTAMGFEYAIYRLVIEVIEMPGDEGPQRIECSDDRLADLIRVLATLRALHESEATQ